MTIPKKGAVAGLRVQRYFECCFRGGMEVKGMS
jgi:hypothetical protein